eukprot:CAMPEP_0113445502 /NCGR_PEP_ID=MMETSP0014_2-20120614/3220_1 /TAXON_ID=2857 /ORGANISM="Nitzschia sp." /LENGTH=220 /DNA_ID=CAMNT_0000336557 /DNA_START=268 /DNA_END=931 /DNA_ORIENTATION=- /assembly_acc=CAM_ASM_000159
MVTKILFPVVDDDNDGTSSSKNTLPGCGGGIFVDAYRVGDLVDAVVSTRSMTNIELLLNSRPLFGVPKTIQLARLPERFSMHFEEGLHSLPYVDGQTLEALVVTFVYSKSGDGRIHSVTSKAIRTDAGSARMAATGGREEKKPIDVVFEWVEEEAVDLSSGTSIMFLAVMMVSIIYLIQLCSIDSDRDDAVDQKFANNNRRKSTSVGYANAGGSRYKHQE